jgi:hypothetical protein
VILDRSFFIVTSTASMMDHVYVKIGIRRKVGSLLVELWSSLPEYIAETLIIMRRLFFFHLVISDYGEWEFA